MHTDDGWIRCQRSGCTNRLTGRQQRFCSSTCRVAEWRDSNSPREQRTCELCGDPFAVRYKNQRICDYNSRQASDDCMSLQDDLDDERTEVQYGRESTTCEREGCDVATYRPGRGRPKRFCSPRCKTAHYRAAKRAQTAA